ncbi:MAG: hypothetical protein HYX47_00885 [Burkholderiales bacterium]|nr:hypothetical protein [Burkholderiales bacterium]
MRHLILVLMIALLPVRGWVGEAMAGQMLAQQLSAIKTIAAHAQPERSAGHFSPEDSMKSMADCPGHSQPAQGTCSGCQMCSLLALDAAVPTVLPVAPAHPLPVALPAAFASAEPAPGFKPPIS